MKHSEFWAAVDEVFGSAYSRSLVQDLVLGELGRTGAQALDAGLDPRTVWGALCDETQRTEAERWVLVREEPRGRAGRRG